MSKIPHFEGDTFEIQQLQQICCPTEHGFVPIHKIHKTYMSHTYILGRISQHTLFSNPPKSSAWKNVGINRFDSSILSSTNSLVNATKLRFKMSL